MGNLNKKALEYFENEVYQFSIMLKGDLHDDYRKYIEEKMLFYTLSIAAIHKLEE